MAPGPAACILIDLAVALLCRAVQCENSLALQRPFSAPVARAGLRSQPQRALLNERNPRGCDHHHRPWDPGLLTFPLCALCILLLEYPMYESE